MGGNVTLRQARTEDLDFAWRVYAEAIKPHIAPYIATHFGREWKDEQEKAAFATWWTLENTSVITHADAQVGWLHFEESDREITLVNYCIGSDYRHRGIGSQVLVYLLGMLGARGKPIIHTVLKTSQLQVFFERFGFEVIGEDEITLIMKRPVA